MGSRTSPFERTVHPRSETIRTGSAVAGHYRQPLGPLEQLPAIIVLRNLVADVLPETAGTLAVHLSANLWGKPHMLHALRCGSLGSIGKSKINTIEIADGGEGTGGNGY